MTSSALCVVKESFVHATVHTGDSVDRPNRRVEHYITPSVLQCIYNVIPGQLVRQLLAFQECLVWWGFAPGFAFISLQDVNPVVSMIGVVIWRVFRNAPTLS